MTCEARGFEMKYCLTIITVALLAQTGLAGHLRGGPHDFSSQGWSERRSCPVCHTDHTKGKLKKPPTAIRAMSDLRADEQEGVKANPRNKICLDCHRSQLANGSYSSHDQLPGGGTRSSLPGGADETLPPPVSAGTHASVCIRINSRGTGKDCLGCHDVHNKDSSHLLKKEKEQDPTQP